MLTYHTSYPYGTSKQSNTMVILSDAFQGSAYWKNFMPYPQWDGVMIDLHHYQVFSDWVSKKQILDDIPISQTSSIGATPNPNTAHPTGLFNGKPVRGGNTLANCGRMGTCLDRLHEPQDVLEARLGQSFRRIISWVLRKRQLHRNVGQGFWL